MRRRDLLQQQDRRTGRKSPLSANADLNEVASTRAAPDRWTGFLLHRVSEFARKLYESRMAEIGLRPPQVGILQLLAMGGPLVQARLGEKLGIDKAAIVPNLNQLEEFGLVERKLHPEDGRAFIVYLKPAGRMRLQEAEKMNASISEELFRSVSEDQRLLLHKVLQKIVSVHHLSN